jgi:hypothetical protein
VPLGRADCPPRDRIGKAGEQGDALGGGWDCVVIDPKHIQIESICGCEELEVPGLHWFQVFFETGSGRCFITAGEARRLRELSTGWVKQALSNLAREYGSTWLEQALASSPGLLLHYSDAHEPWEAPGDPGGGNPEEMVTDGGGADSRISL